MRESRFTGLTGLACVLALAGCEAAPDETGRATAELEAREDVTQAPFDMADAIERARAAFSARDGAFVAGDTSHLVEVDEGGDSFRVTPVLDQRSGAVDLTDALPDVDPARTTAGQVRARTPARSRTVAEASFVARTASVARGALRLDAPTDGPVADAGRLLMRRGAVVEELQNRREGLEQSWRFAERPDGDGDLVVRIDVEGMGHVGTTEMGEHFADASTGLGVRYGHGTFVDAAGIETAVPVQFDGSQLVLSVPASVVDAAAYPAVLDPIVGPEVAMDAPIVGARGSTQQQPAVATDGTDYLVVFTDSLGGDLDVRGVRVSSTGTLLDPISFPISVEDADQSQPAVVWNGSTYIVVWRDDTFTDADLYMTTVSATGAVGAVGGTALADTVADEESHSLAVAGTTTLVAYHEIDTTGNVLGVRLGATGARVDASPFVIAGSADFEGLPVAAGSADTFVVAYTGATSVSQNVHAVRLDADAAAASIVLDATPLLLAAGTDATTAPITEAAAAGADFLVVWSETNTTTARRRVLGRRVPLAGALVSVSATELSPAAAGRDYAAPSVAFGGSQYLVAYVDGVIASGAFSEGTIGAARVSEGASGALTVTAGPAPTSIAGDTFQPAVTAQGTTFFVAYTDITGPSAEIRGTTISGGTVGTPAGILLSVNPNDQTAPVIGSDTANYLVAWLDYRNGGADIWGARIDPAGSILGGGPFAITSSAGTEIPSGVAFSGSHYVLVFEVPTADDQNVRGVLVTASGVVGSEFDIATSANIEFGASVACHAGITPDPCLVAFSTYDATVDPIDANIRAARVNPATTPPTVTAPGPVVSVAGNQFAPSVAASATQFYVAWIDDRSSTDRNVRGTRYITTPLEDRLIGGAAGAQYSPSVASDGTDFLVAFVDERAGGTTPGDIYFQRVASTGTLLGSNTSIAASAAHSEFAPKVSFNGNYLVGWTRADATDARIQAARADASGAVLDTTPFDVTTGAPLADSPRLAAAGVTASGAPRWLMAYRSFGTGTVRVVARTITDDLFTAGATCTAASECISGFCVDGVCCDTACTDTCDVCSAALGASADGTCTTMAGCGPDAGTDAGPPDAGTDAGTDGGGVVVTDGGVIEDGGATTDDGGVIPEEDAGIPTEEDAGVISMPDSGPTPMVDGGPTPGVDAGMGVEEDGGCGCSTPGTHRSGGGPLALTMLGLGFAVLRRRRR